MPMSFTRMFEVSAHVLEQLAERVQNSGDAASVILVAFGRLAARCMQDESSARTAWDRLTAHGHALHLFTRGFDSEKESMNDES